MTLNRPRIALILASALALVVLRADSGRAVPCPTTVTFEGATSSDLGFTGIGHRVDTGALEIALAVSNCAGAEFGSCGVCDVSGPLPSLDGRNRRCRGDLSLQCVVDADCGGAGPCRTYAGPPGPIEAGGFELCVINEITGPITGTVAPDAGSLAMSVPLDMRAIEVHGIPIGGFIPPYWNPSYRPCPTCTGGVCQGGTRDGLPCQVDATNPSFGDTSYDCPSSQADDRLMSGVVPLSTATQTVVLTSASPNCKGTGSLGGKCYCDTCNDAAATPCMSNADCVAVGATICGGKRCAQSGMACSNQSQCPGSFCIWPGEPTRPDSCVGPDGEPPEGCEPSGVCADGPIQEYCAEPEAHRYCSTPYAAETCPLTSSCANFALRPCFYDDGNGVTVSGAANPPIGGISSAAVGGLLCAGVPEIPVTYTNNIFGFPGLARFRSEGTLTFGDGTPMAGNCPLAPAASCRATAPRGAKLEIRRAVHAEKRSLQWRWRKGAATLASDFGDPLTTEPYDLCVYHQGWLVVRTRVEPGGICGGKPCWQSSPQKVTFRNRDTQARAATRIDLKPGTAGKSAISFAAAGPHLALPDLATLTGPVEVQLHRWASDICWGATFPLPFDRLDLEKGTLRAEN